MFKQKTVYEYQIDNTDFFVEIEIEKDTDGELICEYWVGHKRYGTKFHSIGLMAKDAKEIFPFASIKETINRFKEEVMDEIDL